MVVADGLGGQPESEAASRLAIVTLVLRQGPRLGVLVGLALAQTGEFSFVLAAEAARAGLLAPDLHQVFVAGSVVTLAANLGIPVLAEGVETDEQLAFLRALACDEGQGYLFGRPAPSIASRAKSRTDPGRERLPGRVTA